MGATLLGITFECSSTETYDKDKFRIDGEHRAVYKIQCDDITDREDTVITATGCPYIGMDSTIMPGAKCIERSINEVGAGVWDVEAVFSQNYIAEPDGQDPWDASPVWSWGFETMDEPLLFDAQSPKTAILNSARQAFSPPIARPIAVPVLTIERYELTFSGQTILTYVNQVNSEAFWGAPANCVLCAGISAQQETIGEFKCWKVTYTFKFNMTTTDDQTPEVVGWKARILDYGSFYWSGAVGSSKKMPFGEDALNPQDGMLDGHGHKNVTETPEFVTYNRYKRVDFNTLKLGPWS
jgi:hypothetical protein